MGAYRKSSFKRPYRRIRTGFRKTSGFGNSRIVERSASIPLRMTSGYGLGQGCVLAHSEYLGEVPTLANAIFLNEGQWLINPGNAYTFPWLSTIANNFEEYQFVQLIFEFRSTSSDALASNNTQLGVVIGCTDYNVAHQPFPDKSTMDNYEYCISGKPSLSWKYPVDCNPKHNVAGGRLYVTNALDLAALNNSAQTGLLQDPKMYFLGAFQIATSGFQTAMTSVGELWVHYKVKLFKPASLTLGGIPVASNASWSQFEIGTFSSGFFSALTGWTTTTPWGTQQVNTFITPQGSTVGTALYGNGKVSSGQMLTNNYNTLNSVQFSNGTGAVTIFDQLPLGTKFFMLAIVSNSAANMNGGSWAWNSSTGTTTYAALTTVSSGGNTYSALNPDSTGVNTQSSYGGGRWFKKTGASAASCSVTCTVSGHSATNIDAITCIIIITPPGLGYSQVSPRLTSHTLHLMPCVQLTEKKEGFRGFVEDSKEEALELNAYKEHVMEKYRQARLEALADLDVEMETEYDSARSAGLGFGQAKALALRAGPSSSSSSSSSRSNTLRSSSSPARDRVETKESR